MTAPLGYVMLPPCGEWSEADRFFNYHVERGTITHCTINITQVTVNIAQGTINITQGTIHITWSTISITQGTINVIHVYPSRGHTPRSRCDRSKLASRKTSQIVSPMNAACKSYSSVTHLVSYWPSLTVVEEGGVDSNFCCGTHDWCRKRAPTDRRPSKWSIIVRCFGTKKKCYWCFFWTSRFQVYQGGPAISPAQVFEENRLRKVNIFCRVQR